MSHVDELEKMFKSENRKEKIDEQAEKGYALEQLIHILNEKKYYENYHDRTYFLL